MKIIKERKILDLKKKHTIFMKVSKPLGRSNCNTKPSVPFHHRLIFPCNTFLEDERFKLFYISHILIKRNGKRGKRGLTVEVEFESLISNKLVNEKFLLIGDAVTDEGDEVAVVDAADDLHLRLKLALALSAAALQALHRHLPSVGEDAFVNKAEAALP